MHKIRDAPNPGMPIGNPIHALNEGLVLPSANIERERGAVRCAPLVSLDSTLDEDFLDNLLSSPRREERVSSPHQDEPNEVLITPPSRSPFEYQRRTQDLYSWFRNSPSYEDF